jgi:hypothetical protein
VKQQGVENEILKKDVKKERKRLAPKARETIQGKKGSCRGPKKQFREEKYVVGERRRRGRKNKE